MELTWAGVIMWGTLAFVGIGFGAVLFMAFYTHWFTKTGIVAWVLCAALFLSIGLGYDGNAQPKHKYVPQVPQVECINLDGGGG